MASRAVTDASAADPGLRGRTLPIPFERVWQAALALLHSRSRWTITHEDDVEGVIRAEVVTPLRARDDFTLRVGLDADAQTRVDAISSSRRRRPDLGRNARRVRRFLRALDKALARRS